MAEENLDASQPPVTRAAARMPTELASSVLVPGTGRRISPGWCAFHSTCTTREGTLVECSRRRGTPWKAVWGANMLLPGLEAALAGMREGERRRVEIPAALAFGAAGAKPAIAPGTDLVYDIELLDVLGEPWRPAPEWITGPADPGIASA